MFNNLKVGSRLFILTVLSVVVAIIIVLFSANGMKKMAGNMDGMYGNNIQSLAYLSDVTTNIESMNGDIFRALQHDPAAPSSKLHTTHTVDEHLRSAAENLKQVEDGWKAYAALPVSGDEKQLQDQFSADWDKYISTIIRPTLASLHNGDFSSEVTKNVLDGYRNIGVPLNNLGEKLTTLNKNKAADEYKEAEATHSQALAYMWIAFALGLIVSLVISWLIIRSILTPLINLQTTIGEVKQRKDLTRRADASGSNEVGQTAGAFNQLMQALQEALKKIVSQIEETSKGVDALTAAAEQVAKSSESQSSSTAAMAASVEEMTVSINTVSSSSDDAQAIAHDAGETSEEGGKIIVRTTTEMGGISQVVGKASDVIQALGEESKQISSVVQVIKEVADQTNLLALNAAIEAARAGEHGRGFAVVADEVRKLAERTTQSTIDISDMIGKIQVSANGAVEEMGRVVQQVESGQALAQEAGERMVAIREKSHKVSDAITEISNALKEQNQASQEISRHVENISQMTEENSAAAEETASAAERLDQLATSVKNTVEQFKV